MRPVVMFDVDGVLADFVLGFTRLAHELSNGMTPVFSHTDSCQWDFDPAIFSRDLVGAVWTRIRSDSSFWSSLPLLASELDLQRIARLLRDVDGYFVTNRSGVDPRGQTMLWLRYYGIPAPTVLISDRKAEIAAGLRADYSIEDKPGSAVMISYWSPTTKSFLVDRPYNQFDPNVLGSRVTRVPTVAEFLTQVEEAG